MTYWVVGKKHPQMLTHTLPFSSTHFPIPAKKMTRAQQYDVRRPPATAVLPVATNALRSHYVDRHSRLPPSVCVTENAPTNETVSPRSPSSHARIAGSCTADR